MNDIERYRQRRDARIKEKVNADEEWITMNGSHILIDDEGTVKAGAGGKFNGTEYKRGSKKGSARSQLEEPAKVIESVSGGKKTGAESAKGEKGKPKESEKSGADMARERMIEKARPKTKLELMQENKSRYEKVQNEVKGMKPGLERDVKEKLILPWIKGDNWMGGLPDRKFDQISKKMPYSFEEIYDEFNRQMMKY